MSETKMIKVSELQENLEVTRTNTYVTDLPSVGTLLNLKRLPKLPTEISLSGPQDGLKTESIQLESQGGEETSTGFTNAQDLPFDLPPGAPPLPQNVTKKTQQTQSHVKFTTTAQAPVRCIPATRRFLQDSKAGAGMTSSFPRLQTRTSDELRIAPDTLSQAIGPLFSEGVNSALVLRPHGSALSAFIAVDAVERLEVWNGFRWGPSSAMDLWNTLQRNHQIELAPSTPGTNNQPESQLFGMSRKVLRSALGAHTKEWVTIVQMEGTDAGSGAVILFSSQSLESQVKKLQENLRPDTRTGLNLAA
jgi:hypothetical protein